MGFALDEVEWKICGMRFTSCEKQVIEEKIYKA